MMLLLLVCEFHLALCAELHADNEHCVLNRLSYCRIEKFGPGP
jgi:hypothetical protein